MNSNQYRLEQRRVDRVVRQIKEQLQATRLEYQRTHHETRNIQKNYGTDTSINYFEVDDRSETRAAVQQYRQLISQNMETENVIKHHLRTLKRLKKSPYFGRIDVRYPEHKRPFKLYIGTASCVDRHEHFLVFDWRAPIASLYYNGTLGPVQYRTPMGKRTAKLLKKRQFSIRNGQITNLFDTNEIVGDEMLQHVLGQKNDQVMHNIVATIQHNQNDIIRDTRSDLLIVQGAAGSGKTSAILQRIAFLLYHSRESLNVSQILLLSPNRLFSHYISAVLPSLGEHNMRQVTLADFLARRFEGLDVQTLFQRYELGKRPTEAQTQIHRFKTGARFMRLIKKYCLKLEPDQMALNEILFHGRRFFGTETIKLLFASSPDLMSPADKFLHVKNQLIIMLKNRLDAEADRPENQRQVDELSSFQYNQFFVDPEARKIRSVNGQRHFIAYQIAKRKLKRVYNAIFNNAFFDAFVQYRRFLTQVPLPKNISPEAWRRSIHNFSQAIEWHHLDLDDAVPLLYLRDLLTGGGRNHDIQYLFIDEMQDYSIAQLLYLKHAFPNAKLNLIGDSEQALFKRIQAPAVFLRRLSQVLKANHPRLIQLNRAYRSTYQITNFAKALLPHGERIQAFNRQGKLPKIIIRNNWATAIKACRNVIQRQLRTNRTVAIITRHLKEAKQIYYTLNLHRDPVTLMTNTDRLLPRGVLIMPVYLAKGLEFDSVVAWNVSAQNYPDTRQLGVLYTIVTRAMHHLTLISIGAVTPLITKSKLTAKNFSLDRALRN